MRRGKSFLVLLIVSVLIVSATPAFGARKDVLKKVRISFLREEYSQTAKECERLLLEERLDADMKAELYYLAGVSFLKQNKFRRAKDNLLLLIARYGRTEFIDDAYLSLGDAYFLSGDVNNAITRYRAFLTKYPQSELVHLAYFRLGESYYRKGQWKGARTYLKKVIREYSQSYEADKAQALLDKGLYFTLQVGAFLNESNAKGVYNKLVRKKYPAFLTTFKKKGRTFYRVRVGKYDALTKAKQIKRRLKKDGFSAQIYP